MGRDYIGERTIADPRMRAAEMARRRRLAAQRRAGEAAPPELDDDNMPSTAAHMTQPPPPRYCLIACSGAKAAAAAPAAYLYQGDLFTKSLAWARRQGCTEVAILSAKHGLVPLDRLVEPYDESLVKATMAQRRRWAEGVLVSLQQRWPLVAQACEVTLLAGRRYTEPLIEMIQEAAPRTLIRRPLAGLGIGQQKAWLASQLRAQPDPRMPTL